MPRRPTKEPSVHPSVIDLGPGHRGPSYDDVLRWIVYQLLQERGLSERSFTVKCPAFSQQNLSRFLLAGGGTTLATVSRLCAWLGEDLPTLLARHPLFSTARRPRRPAP